MIKTLYDVRSDLIMSAEQYVNQGLTIIFPKGGGGGGGRRVSPIGGKVVCMRKIDEINCLSQRCI